MHLILACSRRYRFLQSGHSDLVGGTDLPLVWSCYIRVLRQYYAIYSIQFDRNDEIMVICIRKYKLKGNKYQICVYLYSQK